MLRGRLWVSCILLSSVSERTCTVCEFECLYCVCLCVRETSVFFTSAWFCLLSCFKGLCATFHLHEKFYTNEVWQIDWDAFKNGFHWRGLKIWCHSKLKLSLALFFPVFLSEKSQRRGAVWPDHVPSGPRRERLLWATLHGLCTSAGKAAAALHYFNFHKYLNILNLSIVFFPHRIEQSPQLYASDFRPSCSSHRMKALGWGTNRAKGIGSGTIVTSARVRACCGINPFNSRRGSCVPAPLLWYSVKAVEGGKDERWMWREIASMERGVEATSQKAGRVRLGGRGRAVIKNVGESSLESSSVISPSLPLPFACSLPPSLEFFMPCRAWTSRRNWSTRAYLWACWTSEFSAAQLHLTNIAAGYFVLIWLPWPLYIRTNGFHPFCLVSALARCDKKHQKTSQK